MSESKPTPEQIRRLDERLAREKAIEKEVEHLRYLILNPLPPSPYSMVKVTEITPEQRIAIDKEYKRLKEIQAKRLLEIEEFKRIKEAEAIMKEMNYQRRRR